MPSDTEKSSLVQQINTVLTSYEKNLEKMPSEVNTGKSTKIKQIKTILKSYEKSLEAKATLRRAMSRLRLLIGRAQEENWQADRISLHQKAWRITRKAYINIKFHLYSQLQKVRDLTKQLAD